MSEAKTAIERAYEEAMAAMRIDGSSVELVGDRVSVLINGKRYTARVVRMTVGGIEAALVNAAAEHCATEAALAVAKGGTS